MLTRPGAQAVVLKSGAQLGILGFRIDAGAVRPPGQFCGEADIITGEQPERLVGQFPNLVVSGHIDPCLPVI